MTGYTDAERVLDAFLAPEHDQLADRVLEAALADIARTPQRRALRVPWRFPKMAVLDRTTVVAAVVLVAVVGAGGALFFTSGGPAPTRTRLPRRLPHRPPRPPLAPTPAASEVAPGITGWTTYTSEVYGITFGYPDGWTLESAATRKWEGAAHRDDFFTYSDSFMNPEICDGDQIAMGVWQQPAGTGADITSREGLAAWAKAHVCDETFDACDTVPDVAIPMCLGREACLPALVVPLSDSTAAVVANAETGMVTVVSLGRPDGFPAAARYGGAVQLIKSILTTMDVWTPEPGQIPPSG